jgi:hypothetical protein
MASSRVQIAEFASVSRQAVHKALRRGWLTAEADGRIESHDRFWQILLQKSGIVVARLLRRFAEAVFSHPAL